MGWKSQGGSKTEDATLHWDASRLVIRDPSQPHACTQCCVCCALCHTSVVSLWILWPYQELGAHIHRRSGEHYLRKSLSII